MLGGAKFLPPKLPLLLQYAASASLSLSLSLSLKPAISLCTSYGIFSCIVYDKSFVSVRQTLDDLVLESCPTNDLSALWGLNSPQRLKSLGGRWSRNPAGFFPDREERIRKKRPREAPLEVVGDPVLEPGGRADLPFRELLLQPVACDLAQSLHKHTHKYQQTPQTKEG
jgi:hypothetical protein